jgi:hypothetical protein
MKKKEKADLRLNCLYAAIRIMGVDSSSSLTKGEKEPRPRPTTEDVLVEARKLFRWLR